MENKPEAGPHVPDHLNDEHWGKGGQFVVDPATGKRVPVVEESATALPEVNATPATVLSSPDFTVKKGK
jgi:hypothetical protein